MGFPRAEDSATDRLKAIFTGLMDTVLLVCTAVLTFVSNWIVHDVLDIHTGLDLVGVIVLQVIFAITTVGAMGIYAVRDLVRLFRREFA
jgi:hypothetical protein